MHIHHSQRLKICPKVLPPFLHQTTSETTPTFVMAHFSEHLTKWLRTRPLRRGVEGLGLKCNLTKLSLISFGGLVPDSRNGDLPWSLG